MTLQCLLRFLRAPGAQNSYDVESILQFSKKKKGSAVRFPEAFSACGIMRAMSRTESKGEDWEGGTVLPCLPNCPLPVSQSEPGSGTELLLREVVWVGIPTHSLTHSTQTFHWSALNLQGEYLSEEKGTLGQWVMICVGHQWCHPRLHMN